MKSYSMEPKEVKQLLLEIFGMQIKFNKEFDTYILQLKEGMISDFIDWCKGCKEDKEIGSVPSKKEYKHFYVFFRKIGSNVRVTLIKEQNKEFVEIKLEDHKGYDITRQHLGYKKSSYYGS